MLACKAPANVKNGRRVYRLINNADTDQKTENVSKKGI